VVLPNRTGMKRARVNCAAMSISGKELGEGRVKIIGNEGGDDILVTIRDNEEMTCTDGVKVVLPARARKHTWLRACGTWGMSLCVEDGVRDITHSKNPKPKSSQSRP